MMARKHYIIMAGRLHCLVTIASVGAAWGQGLNVYRSVPGLDSSLFYRLQVREASSDTWLEAFTLVTECTAEKFCNTTGFYSHLGNWSNSYINFEMEAGAQNPPAKRMCVAAEDESPAGARCGTSRA